MTNDHARAFSAWVSAFELSAEGIVAVLLALPEHELADLVERKTQVFTAAAVDRVVTFADSQLSKNPKRAEQAARLAMRLCEVASLGTTNGDSLILLEARACRALASAHLKLGQYAEGLKAVARAKINLQIAENAGLEAVLLALIEGQLLHHTGRSEEGLILLEETSVVLLARHPTQKKTYLKARTIYASIVLDRKEYQEALTIYEEAADMAERIGDSETLAYIVQNVGYCCLQLGNTPHAERCFSTALQMFEELHLDVEVQRARGGLVKVLIARGKYNEAISELYKVRAIFLSMGLPILAAMVALDIVDLLFLANRTSDVRNLCQEMFTTFSEANLPKNALMAVAYLAGLSKEVPVDAEEVAHVRRFLQSLEQDPDKPFHAPTN